MAEKTLVVEGSGLGVGGLRSVPSGEKHRQSCI